MKGIPSARLAFSSSFGSCCSVAHWFDWLLHGITDQMICARVIIRSCRLLTKNQLLRVLLDNLQVAMGQTTKTDTMAESLKELWKLYQLGVRIAISHIHQNTGIRAVKMLMYSATEGGSEEIYTCNLLWWPAWSPMHLCSCAWKLLLRKMLTQGRTNL